MTTLTPAQKSAQQSFWDKVMTPAQKQQQIKVEQALKITPSQGGISQGFTPSSSSSSRSRSSSSPSPTSPATGFASPVLEQTFPSQESLRQAELNQALQVARRQANLSPQQQATQRAAAIETARQSAMNRPQKITEPTIIERQKDVIKDKETKRMIPVTGVYLVEPVRGEVVKTTELFPQLGSRHGQLTYNIEGYEPITICKELQTYEPTKIEKFSESIGLGKQYRAIGYARGRFAEWKQEDVVDEKRAREVFGDRSGGFIYGAIGTKGRFVRMGSIFIGAKVISFGLKAGTLGATAVTTRLFGARIGVAVGTGLKVGILGATAAVTGQYAIQTTRRIKQQEDTFERWKIAGEVTADTTAAIYGFRSGTRSKPTRIPTQKDLVKPSKPIKLTTDDKFYIEQMIQKMNIQKAGQIRIARQDLGKEVLLRKLRFDLQSQIGGKPSKLYVETVGKKKIISFEKIRDYKITQTIRGLDKAIDIYAGRRIQTLKAFEIKGTGGKDIILKKPSIKNILGVRYTGIKKAFTIPKTTDYGILGKPVSRIEQKFLLKEISYKIGREGRKTELRNIMNDFSKFLKQKKAIKEPSSLRVEAVGGVKIGKGTSYIRSPDPGSGLKVLMTEKPKTSRLEIIKTPSPQGYNEIMSGKNIMLMKPITQSQTPQTTLMIPLTQLTAKEQQEQSIKTKYALTPKIKEQGIVEGISIANIMTSTTKTSFKTSSRMATASKTASPMREIAKESFKPIVTTAKVFKPTMIKKQKAIIQKIPKTTPPLIFSNKVIRSFKQPSERFPVYGRRFGKFQLIGVGRTEREAFSLGKRWAGTTLGVTFKIPGVSGKKVKGFKTKVRDGKVLYVEPRGRRLKRGTREIAEINLYKKAKKRRSSK
jgi:hypothetical protein